MVNLFTDPTVPGCLGYTYLGNWHDRPNNRCIESDLLRANLKRRGYSEAHISAAFQKLLSAADTTGVSLYESNLRTYTLLRYGVSVQIAAGRAHDTVHLIDWEHPENNDFGLAEEITLRGGFERRPDIVLYLNGLAIAVIELKRGSVEVAEGIRQLITNQEEIFNKAFFSTVQFVFAGNDSQGLRYGTVETPEKFFVEWKGKFVEGEALSAGALLDRPLAELCAKSRMLDLIKNFILFDAGHKKVPRPHQFEGVKAAQLRIQRREGGIIWHTQGSGKSILMVLLAKWILEQDAEARVLVVTDRDELDTQIEQVMRNAGVIDRGSPSSRITSRAEFVEKLRAFNPRLLCALIHKFDLNLDGNPPPISGRFYVFVDECHRTQGGEMHQQMKRWLQGAIFIGFTGTPLLRKDKQTSREIFGTYIHTYKFHQAVMDKVVLDLKYEARVVDQVMTAGEAVDNWFQEKTRGLNDYQRSVLRQRWATLKELMSSGERKQRIVVDIIHDFGVRPRLNNDRGTAMLVAASIYDACHYFRLFQNTQFGRYCGIITSYEPTQSSISREPENSDERYKYDTYTQSVLSPGQTTKQYETGLKDRFIKDPAHCKLLIVVSKLLTGFDAPPCTYIYLDHELRDHTLFQAICRTNRLDGDDKEYGRIVDYKELFQQVQNSIAVYTSDELDSDDGAGDGNVLLKDWHLEGKKNLDEAREALRYLCEPVPPPRELEQYLHFFCGDAANPDGLTETEPLRIAYYKAAAAFIRAYAEVASVMMEVGYAYDAANDIQDEVAHCRDIRDAIKRHSGEEMDLKPFEGDMRHLINTYVLAGVARDLGNLDTRTLTQLIVDTGIHDAIAQKLNQQGKLSKNAVAEGIVNNIRKTIIRDHLTDPRFYEGMAKLLEDLIRQRREDTESYERFLKQAEALARQLETRQTSEGVPACLHGKHEASVLFNNLASIPVSKFQCPADPEAKAELALRLDRVMREKAPASFKGDETREAQVLNALYPILACDRIATQAIFDIIKNQSGYS